MLRQRAFYVGKQTSVKNRLRALLAQQGEEIGLEVERVENLFTDKGRPRWWGRSGRLFERTLTSAVIKRMKRRKGANSAKVATARRLLTIIYRMLKENRSSIPYKR